MFENHRKLAHPYSHANTGISTTTSIVYVSFPCAERALLSIGAKTDTNVHPADHSSSGGSLGGTSQNRAW